MARRRKKSRVVETPSERFDRVLTRVTNRDRKARMKSKDQPRWKVTTAAR